ncbi:MAG: D-alanine--D-alanine ligase [Oscillospiraceae bacterium]|nr:D-alanine--D-alanine ligase [Oscillospiraceae bacterium]
MKVVVLAGGLSPERDVSLASGSLIANALMENGHKVFLLDLYKGIASISDDLFVDSTSNKRFEYKVENTEPDLEALKREVNNGDSLIGKNVIELCLNADVVFLALHGDIGENGKLQALFDCYGIKYTGSSYTASLLAMDKDIAKKLMVYNNIKTANWKLVNIKEHDENLNDIEFPCVVKPCSCGSSVGVSIVKNKGEFLEAIESAKKYEENILIEKMIKGREFSIGILEGEALPIIEIIPKEGFYDYKNKYQAGFTKEVCPAEIDEATTKMLQDIAKKVHNALRLGSYARIDFILDEAGEAFCLEANTLPGMTPTSLLPQEARAIGISYNELCERILNLALNK